MQIKLTGEMTLVEIRQILFEKLHEIEGDYAVRYSVGATLYLNPTNGFGDRVVPHNRLGQEVKKLYSTGAYRSAAADYTL